MRLALVATVLLVSGACSHAPPPTETAKVERRDDWLLALTSDLDRIAAIKTKVEFTKSMSDSFTGFGVTTGVPPR